MTVQGYGSDSSLAVVGIFDGIATAFELGDDTSGVVGDIGVFLTFLGGCGHARASSVGRGAVGNGGAVREKLGAKRAVGSVGKGGLVSACFVIFGDGSALFVTVGKSIKFTCRVEGVIGVAFLDLAVFVVDGFFYRFALGELLT